MKVKSISFFAVILSLFLSMPSFSFVFNAQKEGLNYLLEVSKSEFPEDFNRYRDKFHNLAQMCRHANNLRFPNDIMETDVPTPKLGGTGTMTKNQALIRQAQYENLSSQILKEVESIEASFNHMFPESTCTETLIQFSPERLILRQVTNRLSELKQIIENGEFKNCAQRIEGVFNEAS